MTTTTIAVGDDYEVVVGHGCLGEAARLVPEGARQVLVVTTASVRAYAESVAEGLTARGLLVTIREVPEGEAAKTVDVLADLWGVLGRAGFTRSDALVCVGGGAVTDAGGFAAASWLRGVAVVQVPTTLLAMVDAAVGGKTGLNTAEGKNLVGAFHPPAGVVCDLDVLATLPPADLRAGLAEVVKCGLIVDGRILELVEADPAAALDPAGAVLRELVERAVAVKADVVAADLKEGSLREILNYGHTFAHAIENVEEYRPRHGDAVAVGLVYAAELARLAGRLTDEDVERHRRILVAVGLPTTYVPGRFDALLAAMRRDKKSRGATLRFVVLDGIGRPGRLAGPDEGMLEAAYARVSGPA